MKIVIKLNDIELKQAIRDYIGKLDLPYRAKTYVPDDIQFEQGAKCVDMSCTVIWEERLK